MKTSLILLALFAAKAFAVSKKPDMRQGKKALEEKNLESINGKNSSRDISSQNAHANQDKTQQLESKRPRQYQEERPENE